MSKSRGTEWEFEEATSWAMSVGLAESTGCAYPAEVAGTALRQAIWAGDVTPEAIKRNTLLTLSACDACFILCDVSPVLKRAAGVLASTR